MNRSIEKELHVQAQLLQGQEDPDEPDEDTDDPLGLGGHQWRALLHEPRQDHPDDVRQDPSGYDYYEKGGSREKEP